MCQVACDIMDTHVFHFVLLNFVLMVGAREYCETETFSASCPHGHVVLLQSALYGRMRTGRCVSVGVGLGCEADVIQHFHTQCSGRPACAVAVSDLLQVVRNPCDMEYRNYLYATYTCIPVYTPMTGCSGMTSVILTSDVTLLSSYVTRETKCGSYDNPWLLRAAPGRQINVSIYDFSSKVGAQGPDSPYCSVYATLNEPGGIGTRTICGGESRVGQVVTTLTNQIEVLITDTKFTTERQAPMYLLSVNAVGCATPALSPDTTFTRYGSEADISCRGDTEKRHVVCRGDTWVGSLSNCSAGAGIEEVRLGGVVGSSTLVAALFSKEHSVWTVSLVALLVGVGVLTAGVVYLKRRALSAPRPGHTALSKDVYWPPPPPPEALQSHYDPSYKPRDLGDNQSNAYYRTWQLQRHQQTTGHMTSSGVGHVTNSGFGHVTNHGVDPPPYPDVEVEDNATMGRYKDHIYESPKFERAIMGDSCNMRGSSSSGSYFEVHESTGGPVPCQAHSRPV